MFLHDFAYADAPADLVCARILENQRAWLSHLATEAVGEGEALRVRIGPAEPVPGPSVAAVVELGGAGGRLDQIAFHRIAEASVRAFLRLLAGVFAQPPLSRRRRAECSTAVSQEVHRRF